MSQSVIGKVRLSNGSAHLGSESERQTQQRIPNTKNQTKDQHSVKLKQNGEDE